jgi:hypothetical protein
MSAFLERLRHPSISNEPPDRSEIRRNDLLTVLCLLFALFLGAGIRNNALSAAQPVTLGDNLLQISLPAGWVRTMEHETAVSVWNARSPSAFDATIDVSTRRLQPGENLMAARAALGLRRGQELPRYRELQADSKLVLNLIPGTLVTYAYVADPTRDAGALGPPVVVQGQDLLFIYQDHLFTISVAADAAYWNEEVRAFDLVFNSLHVREARP